MNRRNRYDTGLGYAILLTLAMIATVVAGLMATGMMIGAVGGFAWVTAIKIVGLFA